jgi:hypothetical protein
MAKIWVLDTETKGTGARMVPLDEVLKKKRSRDSGPIFVPREVRERPAPAPEPKEPRTFKVVDVLTREVLAEGASTRATVELLKDVRSVVDVRVSVWEPKRERWRLLTLDEQKALWRFRAR